MRRSSRRADGAQGVRAPATVGKPAPYRHLGDYPCPRSDGWGAHLLSTAEAMAGTGTCVSAFLCARTAIKLQPNVEVDEPADRPVLSPPAETPFRAIPSLQGPKGPLGELQTLLVRSCSLRRGEQRRPRSVCRHPSMPTEANRPVGLVLVVRLSLPGVQLSARRHCRPDGPFAPRGRP